MVLRAARFAPVSGAAVLTVPGTVKILLGAEVWIPFLTVPGTVKNDGMELERALAVVRFVVAEAPGPVSVFVADTHGEVVAAATMDAAAPDTRLNAQRKAYTAARSDARATREMAGKVEDDPVKSASLEPFFTFFLGGVAVFEDGVRVGAVGVSGLPGEQDEKLAIR